MGRKGVERGVDSTSADLKNLTLNICSFLSCVRKMSLEISRSAHQHITYYARRVNFRQSTPAGVTGIPPLE